jgi:hypothetical protein
MMISRVREFVDKKVDGSKDRSTNIQAPPPLKISNSNYANDDTFKKVSLTLLSRFEALETSAAETISATLVSQEERASFYEALRFRLALLPRQEMHTGLLAQQIEHVFGEELRNQCHHHHVLSNSLKLGEQPGLLRQPPPPITPRNDQISSYRVHGRCHQMEPPARRRSFFPDAGCDGKSAMMPTKIRNIDWQLANAVQQVVSLSLEGPPPTEKREFACYEPPTTPMHCQAV